MKTHVFIVRSEDDQSSAQLNDAVRSAGRLHNGFRSGVDAHPAVLGDADELYGAKELMMIAVSRDIMHTVLKRRNTEELHDGDLLKIGALAEQLVNEHPEMWAIRVKYADELAKVGIDLGGTQQVAAGLSD